MTLVLPEVDKSDGERGLPLALCVILSISGRASFNFFSVKYF